MKPVFFLNPDVNLCSNDDVTKLQLEYASCEFSLQARLIFFPGEAPAIIFFNMRALCEFHL